MDTIVRVGVVGTSWYPDWAHLPLLKSHPQAQVSAICGRNKQRAEELAAKYSIPKVFSDYHEMFQKAGLDAVVIAVPDDMHYPITMAALEAGLHVLCEKPMAFTLAQAKEMLATAEARHLRNMIFFTYRWWVPFRVLHKLVSEGYLGEIYDAQFIYASGYARGGWYQWKWDQARGLGVLGDLGSHMIDAARWLVGDIASVQARLSSRIEKPHPEGLAYALANDTAHLLLQFASDVTGALYASAAVETGSRGQDQRILLFGSEGTLELQADAVGYIVRGLRKGQSDYETFPVPAEFKIGSEPGAQPWDEMIQTFSHQSIGTRLFIDSIVNGHPSVPGFYEGMKTQAVIEAALESNRTGCRVDVEKD